MKRLINDTLRNKDIFVREMGIALILLGTFAVIALFVFAVWGNA